MVDLLRSRAGEARRTAAPRIGAARRPVAGPAGGGPRGGATGPHRGKAARHTGVVAAAVRRPVDRAAQLGVLGAVLVAALLVRLPGTGRAYDVFIDETTYAAIARSVAGGHGVSLYGRPFILHPPVGFWILGAAARAVPPTDPLGLIIALRGVCVVFGAVVVVLVLAACWAARLHLVGIVAAAWLVFDPFVLSYDGRVMLEAIAQAFVAATVTACVIASLPRNRDGRAWPCVAGVAGATAFSTKETFGLVVCLLFLIMIAVPAAMTRRGAVTALAVTLSGYAGVNVAVAARVGFGAWLSARSSGLARLTGVRQTTGFKAPGVKVTLTSRFAATLDQYGPSYLVLVLGGSAALVSGIVAARWWYRTRGAPLRRSDPGFVFLAWTVAACGYVAYAVAFGSLEEQMFYIAVAPCAVTTAILVVDLARGGARLRRAVLAAAAVLLLVQVGVYGATRARPDDTYAQLLAWLPRHVPAGSTVAVTEDTAQFLVRGEVLGTWADEASLRTHHVDYVVVSPELADQGYGTATPAFLTRLARDGRLVARFAGRPGDATLRVYDVRSFTRTTR